MTDSPAATANGPAGAAAARSSRLGGALLLVVIVAAIVVGVVLLTNGGGSKRHTTGGSASTETGGGSGETASSGTKSTGTGTTGTGTSSTKPEARFTLKSPEAGSRSTGTVALLSEGEKKAFYIQAEHIPSTKGFFYAIWLYNSPTSALPLSKAPSVGSNHKLAGAALLPSNASNYHEILLTEETSSRPTKPGHIVLRGPFSVSG